MADFHKRVIFQKSIFAVFSLDFWSLMLTFHRNVAIQIVYKVTEGFFAISLCFGDTLIFIRKKVILGHFWVQKVCISGTKAFCKNPLCNFVENLNAYTPVKFQYQGPKTRGKHKKRVLRNHT